MSDFKYVKPEVDKELITLCFELFDKDEAIDRIYKYINGIVENFENQILLQNSINRSVSNLNVSLKKRKGRPCL